uniref:GATA transcription factor 18 isoform X3 n=1 Tax=Rhizophora mucronata TaxID=61149 RepID=A0A2P2M8T5_RHIMU
METSFPFDSSSDKLPLNFFLHSVFREKNISFLVLLFNTMHKNSWIHACV